MVSAQKRGFTLIELLVVIAIIGMLSTLAVVALNSARQKSRDSKRVTDIKQIQSALELYYNDKNGYPYGTALVMGETGAKALCAVGWTSGPCADAASTYMGLVPDAIEPIDGAICQSGTNNKYTYTSTVATDYKLTFCLGAGVGGVDAGLHTASRSGIQ